MKVNRYVDLRNSRGGTQDDAMKQIIAGNEDPFSERNLPKHHKKPILHRTQHWLITESQWPYQNTEKHILFITKRFVEKPSELTSAEWLDLQTCICWTEENLGIDGGGFAMRFGNTTKSGATVKHLHAHIVVPNLESQTYDKERVKFFIGGNKKQP